MRTTRRTVAILGVVAILAIAIGIALSWREIQVKYHLHRLRTEPGYLKEVVNAPEKSIQRSAIVKYLGTADGKQQLFEAFLETHEQSISIALNRVDSFKLDTWEMVFDTGVQQRSDSRTSINTYLSCLVDGSYTSEKHVDLVFSFDRADEELSRRLRESSWRPIVVSVKRTSDRTSHSPDVDR